MRKQMVTKEHKIQITTLMFSNEHVDIGVCEEVTSCGKCDFLKHRQNTFSYSKGWYKGSPNLKSSILNEQYLIYVMYFTLTND